MACDDKHCPNGGRSLQLAHVWPLALLRSPASTTESPAHVHESHGKVWWCRGGFHPSGVVGSLHHAPNL